MSELFRDTDLLLTAVSEILRNNDVHVLLYVWNT